MQDGVNSGLRYYYNNFTDGFKQDSMDLLLGHYQVDTINPISPFKKSKFNMVIGMKFYRKFYAILLLAFVMMFFILFAPTGMYTNY